jgi:hypothetical protein
MVEDNANTDPFKHYKLKPIPDEFANGEPNRIELV